MRRLSEPAALAQLQRGKAAYQSEIKKGYEHQAQDCRTCATPGVCCTDAHFVNVHITRLEAVHIGETLRRTPRLDDAERRRVYERASEAIRRYRLSSSGDTFRQTYSCPLFELGRGCLVHTRAKPAPCIQHACYENWEDMPPAGLQWRMEKRVEQLNTQVYGQAWAWLPIPVWLMLVDAENNSDDISELAHEWNARRMPAISNAAHRAQHHRRSLPVIR